MLREELHRKRDRWGEETILGMKLILAVKSEGKKNKGRTTEETRKRKGAKRKKIGKMRE